MNAIADALVYAVTYINLAPGDDTREDDDCGALECIGTFLNDATVQELQALREAVDRAIQAEKALSSPRIEMLEAYNDFKESILDS